MGTYLLTDLFLLGLYITGVLRIAAVASSNLSVRDAAVILTIRTEKLTIVLFLGHGEPLAIRVVLTGFLAL
jgi:hypothetical protein